ncbi:glycoside hydrolase family 3 C-terminal domain-containing protein [Streptomyces sp. B21-102]
MQGRLVQRHADPPLDPAGRAVRAVRRRAGRVRRGGGPGPAEDLGRKVPEGPRRARGLRRGTRRRGRSRPGAAGRPHRPAAADRGRRRHGAGAGGLGRGRPDPARSRRPLPLGRRGRPAARLRRPAGRLGRAGDVPPRTPRERSPPAAPGHGSSRACRRRRCAGCRAGRGDRGSPEVFELIVVESGESAVTRVTAGADVVVVVAGNDPHINGRETEDRTTLRLPAHQERLLAAGRAAGARTVLVLVSAYPYAFEPGPLSAALWTAHGGQAAGSALARVLAGDVSPAGRLPQTWYADDADLPDLLDYDVIGARQTYLYFEGAALFPFGHGLSYSSFAYAGLTVRVTDGRAHVACTVTNTGDTTADEVVQLYTRAVDPSVVRPRRELLDCRRITLAPGACADVAFDVPLSAFAFWDVARGGRRLEPGPYELLVGASSEDVRLRATAVLDGEPSAPRAVRADGLAAADFDEQGGTEIVDRTKESGDAVTPVGGGRGELLYRACDFGTRPDTPGVTAVTVTASGRGTVEFSLDGGPVLATVSLGTPTPGPYAYVTLDAPFVADGVHDLRLGLRGPLRLAHVGFSG